MLAYAIWYVTVVNVDNDYSFLTLGVITREELDSLIDAAEAGIAKLHKLQTEVLSNAS